METMVFWFINAFMEVDTAVYTIDHAPLKEVGNYFENRADAVRALQKIKLILKENKNERS